LILPPALHPILASLCPYNTTTTELHTLSLHDALPIFLGPTLIGFAGYTLTNRYVARHLSQAPAVARVLDRATRQSRLAQQRADVDRKSTRLNSSHVKTSYAVFCLKKKKIGSAHVRYPD